MKFNLGRYALVGAFVAAFLAAMGHLQYLKAVKQEHTRTVVVVAKEVAAYQKLDDTRLALKDVPATAVDSDTFSSVAQVQGMYARGLLVKGEILRKSHVMETPGGGMTARLTATGDAAARAMALHVSADTGVASTIQPGDKVDLLVALKVDSSQGRSVVSKIVAQAIPILHTTFEANSATGSKDGTVVLQVSPQLAEDIAFAQTNGTIWLLTRPYDTADQTTAGVDLHTFLRKHGLTVAGGKS